MHSLSGLSFQGGGAFPVPQGPARICVTLVSRFHAEQLFPMPFEGAKVMIQKGLSNHFQTMHTLVLGASPSWQYGATYVGTKKLGENEVSYV